MNALVIRSATTADDHTLNRLAQLDSRRLGAGPHVVAELDGRAVAAVSLHDGAAIADPFTRTTDVITLLRRRANQLHGHGASRRRAMLEVRPRWASSAS